MSCSIWLLTPYIQFKVTLFLLQQKMNISCPIKISVLVSWRCLITKKFVYVYDASINGYGKIKFVTVDTNVIVIAVGIYHLLSVSELWVEVGTGGDRCWYPVHIYANLLGQEKCRALLFWYSLTGCNTLSMFAGKAKRTCWNVWKCFP